MALWSRDPKHGRRGAIFCLTKVESELMRDWVVNLLNGFYIPDAGSHVLLHHSGVSDEEQQGNVRRFTGPEEAPLIVIATSCFGVGIDAGGVSFAVCLGGAYSVLDLTQQLGRAGREGNEATCLVLWYDRHEQILQDHSARPRPHGMQDPSLAEASTLGFFTAASEGRCLRQHLSAFLDGGQGQPCLASAGQLCSSCEAAVSAFNMGDTGLASSPIRAQSPQASLLDSPGCQPTSRGLFDSSGGDGAGLSNSFADIRDQSVHFQAPARGELLEKYRLPRLP